MGILPTSMLILVVVGGIAWAIDFKVTSKTMWMFEYPPPRRKKKLWEILKEAQDEAESPARTYTEASKRMQEREETRLSKMASPTDPPKV